MNHPQAYPKFLANSVVVTADGGLAHVLLIAANVTAMLPGGNTVSITIDTTYRTYYLYATYPMPFSIPR